MNNFNEQQTQAILAPEGPVLVTAGAGSGKTKVLVGRLVHLIRDLKVKPERIIGLTFSTQAAGNMRARVEEALGFSVPGLFLGTFHAWGLKFLRHYINLLGFRSDFSVLDEDDARSVLKAVCKRLGIKQGIFELCREIDLLKNDGCYWEDYLTKVPRELSEVWQQYQIELKNSNCVDFGDLLVLSKVILKKFSDVKERVRALIKHILVDEAQDTNEVQFELITLIAAPPFNIFMVGDEDQCIYSFRGARYENIQKFCEEFSVKQIFKLEQNYRSSQEILRVANAVISNNSSRFDKKLFSSFVTSIKPVYKSFPSEEEEANFVAAEAKEHLARNRTVAVFYRVNNLSRALEEAFLRHGLPYKVFGGVKFFERKEIKDLLSYMRFWRNPLDAIAFARLIQNPPQGIGKATFEKIQNAAGESLVQKVKQVKPELGSKLEKILQLPNNPYAFLKFILDDWGYMDFLVSNFGKDRLDNVFELLGFAKDFEERGKGIEDFLDHFSLMSNLAVEESSGVVHLMTIHASKGLEYDAVFVVGLEEGILPHSLARAWEELEEERRLFYVATTRAKKYLYLTSAYFRSMYFGSTKEVSRFILEIPYDLLDTEFVVPGARSCVREQPKPQLYDGSNVTHPKWGRGVVLKLSGSQALVEFDSVEHLTFVDLEELSPVD